MGALLEYFRELKSGYAVDIDIANAMLELNRPSPYIRYMVRFQNYELDYWTLEGYYLCKYNSMYIPYKERKINGFEIKPGQDALSAPFSGCLMAYCKDENNFEQVCHICLLGPNQFGDRRNEWINFCQKQHTDFKVFRPVYDERFGEKLTGYIDPDYYAAYCKLGLISSEKHFYGITCVILTARKGNDKRILFVNIKEEIPSFDLKSRFLHTKFIPL